MGVFKEITKADGSGVTVFYRTNLASTFDISDLDIDTESVLYRTGEEISQMTEDKPYIVLCTEDYIYTDQYGSLISVERGTVYEMEHGTVVDAISIGGGGGGGGVPRSNLSTANSPLEQNVSIKATVNLSIHFLTTALKKTGTVKLYVNNVMKSTKTVESGEDCEFDVSKYLKLGSNYFTIRTADDNGAEKNFDFLVNAVQLILSSGFNGNIPIPNTFDYIYRIKGSGEKTVHFVLDGVDTTTTTTVSDVDLTQKFSNLSHGAHSLVVYAEAELEGEVMYSNELTYSLLTYNPSSNEIIMLSNFDTETAMEGEQLKIDYLVYNPNSPIASVSMYINNEWVMDTSADRTQHYWTVSNYPSGTVVFKIKCGEVYVEKTVEVEPISVDIQEATEGLELKLIATNRSNQELEPGRSTWHYNDIYCQMNNFNWESNGWVDGRLKLTGKANVVIPFKPFANDLRRTGKTIEVEFITYNAFSVTSKLISCIDDAGIGFDVTLDKSLLASEQESVSTQFGEGAKIRLSFVVESTSSNRLIKTYINGVLSGLKQYAVDDNFQQAVPTNIIINPDEEEIDITAIRIYNRALNSKELVNNWIYDMSDIAEKINTYNKNQIYDYYGNISYAKVKSFLPVVIVTGPMPTYKGDKKKVKVTYEHNLKTNYNFEQENCTIDVQGTSSQYYPRKNWKIKLVDKVQVDDGWLEEKTYCMKADFMESSHTYNIGTATLINDIYDPEDYYPTRTADNGVRDTMNGFPCVLFTKESEDADMYFAGTFMFNNDKADTDTLGYTIDEQYEDTSESWEFKNNTSDHCLFRSADFSPEASPLDNFEARYPDGYEDFTALSRVFEWVVSCKNNPAKFKQEFEQYFNLHYCLVYQVMMELAIMVDSRAKNMFLDTADGIIWYPRFYDMDTCWGLNNEGVPAWSYDVEIHDRIGTAYVWDDRGASEFWNLFEQAYASEIKDMYHTLREEKLTYENILHYYVENISSQFSASEYNEDSEFKYVGPLVDEGNATYLYAAQGNRQDYFRWIVKKRLYYLDSKYEYGDYNNDYATMRWYTFNGDLTITTYQTMYIKVRFGSTDVKMRIEHDTPTTIPAPLGLEFNDTEVIIWGASQIVDFGDLTDKYAGTVDISKCSKLQKLKLCDSTHRNTNLVSLSLGNNVLLRELILTNCQNLAGNLDLSGCSDLRVFNALGTSLTGFTLPVGSVVEELYLPTTLTSLILYGVNSLTTLYAANYSKIKTLIYENSSYPLEDIIAKCAGLSRLRVVFDDNYTSSLDVDFVMYFYENTLGIDEHGYNLPHAYFGGTLNIEIQDYHTSSEIEEYKSIIENYYTLLNVNYIDIPSKFESFNYFLQSSRKANYRIVHDGDYFFHSEPNGPDASGNYVMEWAYQTSSTPKETIPTGCKFIHIVVKSSATGLVFLPQKISGMNVATFSTSSKTVSGYFIPSTYRMFDVDFYIENDLWSYSDLGGSAPKLTISEGLYNGNMVMVITGTTAVGMGYGVQQNNALRSIVFGGEVTIIPNFAGQYLYTFLDTSEAIAWTDPWNWFKEYPRPDDIPFIPCDVSNIKHIGVLNGNGHYESEKYFDIGSFGDKVVLPQSYSGSQDNYMYRMYTGEVDLTGYYFSNGARPAQYMWAYNLVTGNATSTKQIARYLHLMNQFDASSITTIDNSSFSLRYTTPQAPQDFPNLTSIVQWHTTGDNDGYHESYLTAPRLNDITSHNNPGWQQNQINILTDKLISLVDSPNYYAADSYMWAGFYAGNRYNPWLKYGIDCSSMTQGFVWAMSTSSDNPVTEFGGLLNVGQSFVDSNRTIYLRNCAVTSNSVSKDIVLNVINNLYDLTTKDLSATLRIAGQYFDVLTAEEIQIATNKGWTVIRHNF